MLDHRDMEHLRSRGAVEVLAILEGSQHPLLPCFPRKHPGFDGGEVRHDELASIPRNEHGADELGKDIRCVAVDALHHVKAAHFHECSCLIQRGDVVLRQILQLDVPAGVASGTACAVELEQSSGPAIRADTAFRCLVFLDGALCHLKPELQHIHCLGIHAILVQLADHLGDILLAQRVHGDATLIQPGLQLGHGVRVLQPGQLIRFRSHGIRQKQVASDSLLDQFRVDPYATVVDTLIYPVVMQLSVGHWEAFQPLVDVHLRVNVLNAVVLELRPVFREVVREVSGSPAVGLGRLAGRRKQLDEPFALLVLLLCGSQDLADILQGHRQSQRSSHDHRADPVVRRQECAGFQILSGIVLLEIPGKAHALECRIVSDQGHIAVLEVIQKFLWERLPGCKVSQLRFSEPIAFIRCPCNEQDLEAGVRHIAVQTAFLDIRLAVGLNVDQSLLQSSSPRFFNVKKREPKLPPGHCVLSAGSRAVPHRNRRRGLPRHPPVHRSLHPQRHDQTDGRHP